MLLPVAGAVRGRFHHITTSGSTQGQIIASTVVVLRVVLVRYLNAHSPRRPEAAAGHTGGATAA